MADVELKAEQDTVYIPLTGSGDDPMSWPNASMQYLNVVPRKIKDEATQTQQIVADLRPPFIATTQNIASFFSGNMITRDHIAVVQLNDVNIVAAYDSGSNKTYIIQYRYSAATTTKIGEISSTTGGDYIHLSEITIANVPTLAVVWTKSDKSTSKGYYATSSGGVFTAASLTEITDVDFPPKQGTPKILTGPMLQMNGTTYAFTLDGVIANSDINSITSWNTRGVINAIQYPDKGVGLLRYKNLLIAFGDDSMEFFEDIGNPPPDSPLQRVDQLAIKIGCFDAKLYTSINDTIFWVAASSQGSQGIYQLEGFIPKKISNSEIDILISNRISTGYTNVGNTYLRGIYIKGRNQLMLTGCGGINQTIRDITFTLNPLDPNTEMGTLGPPFFLFSQNLIYHIEDNLWWYLTHNGCRNGFGLGFPLPAPYYPSPATSGTTNKYLQLVWFIPDGTGTTSNLFLFTLSDKDITGYDTGVVSNGDINYCIKAAIQFPVQKFKNLNRKFIRSIEIDCDYISASPDGISYSSAVHGGLYVIVHKYDREVVSQTPSADSPIPPWTARGIDVPNLYYRYQAQNLGYMRTMGVTLLHNTPDFVRYKGIYVTVAQGTS